MISLHHEIEKRLKNKHVFIVEEDLDLANNIIKLFSNFTCHEVLHAHTMESARRYFENWSSKYHEYIPDLIIMDVMLPETEKIYKRIRMLTNILHNERKNICDFEHSEELHSAEELEHHTNSRRVCSDVIAEIKGLITLDGGIILVKEMKTQFKFTFDNVPVVYLTAISGDSHRNEGLLAAGRNSLWLVKPVSSDELLESISQVL